MTKNKTSYIVDTHVHLYPCYNIDLALNFAHKNLDSYGHNQKILCLTERRDCFYFDQLTKDPSKIFKNPQNYQFDLLQNQCSLKILDPLNREITLIAGRQIITKEKIEVLALAQRKFIPDQQPITEVLKQINDSNGIPVLSWAPGKWFFKRGKIINQLIEKTTPKNLLLADTSLRPPIWPEPFLFKKANSYNLQIIAGSDPLPFPGEEKYLGSYGITFKSNSTITLREILMEQKSPFEIIGKRCSSATVFNRLIKNYLSH